MYKRILSILLSVLLIVTSFITLFTFSASAASNNLVADGKFEDGFTGWEVFNNTGKSDAAFEVVKEGKNSVVSSVPGLSMFKQVTLQAGVAYTVGFDFKFDTNATVPATYDSFYRVGFASSIGALGNSNFVGPYDTGNKYYSVFPNQKNDSTSWKSHTFTYTPAADMTTYFVVGSYNGDGKANVFIDNVFLCKTEDIVKVTAVAGDGGAVSGTRSTFKGDTVTFSAKASTGHLFDGWYDANGSKVSDDVDYSFTANENVEYSAKFVEGEYDPNMITNGDFVINNLDGFEVFKNGDNSASDFSFVTNASDYALFGKSGHSLYKKVNLKANIKYTMSFDFKFSDDIVPATYDSFYRAGFVSSVGALGGSAFVGPNATGNKYYSVYTSQKKGSITDWYTHSFTYTPSTDMSVYAVIGSYNHQGEADFYIDNWTLYSAEDFVTITATAGNGGSVTGTTTVLKGKTVTLTATADDGYEFVGWFNGDKPVSTDLTYVLTATETVTLLAKFKNTAPVSNYIVNGDFEKPFTTDTISNVSVPAVTGKWGKIYSGVARMEAVESANFTANDSAEKNGTRYITSGASKDANQYIRAFGQYVELPIGNYVLEFDAKSTVDELFVVSVKKGQESINYGTDTILYLEKSDDWQRYTLKFTVDSDSLYQIAFGGNAQGEGEGDFSIDNVELKAYVEAISNYVVNGDFEKPFTTDKISDVSVPAVTGKWGKIYSGVARMEAVESANFTANDSAEKNGTRYITSGATKDANQYIRGFGQYVNLPAGEYMLEFDAKSTADDLFLASIKKGQQSINYGTDTILYLKKSEKWQHYTLTFTVEEDALYQIAFGGNTQGQGEGDFSIDNVKLALYVEEDPELLVNGDFEEPFTADKISDVSIPAVTGKWGKIYSGVARMEAVESGKFTVSDSAEKNGTRYITSGITKDDNQYLRAFGQYVQLPAGTYALSFDAKSTVGNLFVVSIKKGQESIALGSDLIKYLDESSEWKHYTIYFDVESESLYQIAFGGNTQGVGVGDFSIDNVSLVNADGFVSVVATTDGGGKVSYPEGAVKGDVVTFVATPDDGYVFKGWYSGDVLVSADASYTFTVTETVELKAKFEYDFGGDTAMIKNGKFDLNNTVGWDVVITNPGTKVNVIVDETTGSAVAKTNGKGGAAFIQPVSLKAGVEYLISFDIKFDDFSSIPSTYDSYYRSGFLKTSNGGLGNANFIGPNTSGNIYVSLAGNIRTTDKNAWNTISYTYTPDKDLDTWFVIGAYDGSAISDYSIDNVAVLPKADATGISVASVSHGGTGKVSSDRSGLVSPGETVNLTATPDKGSVFGGWYINGTLLSDSPSFSYTVTSNDIVYARFLDANNPAANQMMGNSGFTTGDLTGWGTGNISFANNTVKYVTDEKGESYAVVSESDMLYQTIELEPFSSYMIRITTRIPDIRDKSYGVHDLEFFRFGFSELEHPNVLQSGALVKDPYSYTSALAGICEHEPNNQYHCAKTWGTYTYIYSNNSSDTVLANVVIGAPYCKSDIHVKKFELVKYVDGIVDFESDILYGEEFFNNVKNSSFDEELTDKDWGVKLPSGWSVKNAGVKGTNYLSVSGEQSKTYSFKVRTGATYVVAFSLRTDKVGTSSVSIVDADGNPWGDSFGLVKNKAVFAPKADGKWQRMGAHLYLADTADGYANINIKISGGTNTLDIDDVCITKLGYATHNFNPNVFTDNRFDYENPVWYNPTMFYKLPDGTTVDGAVDDPINNSNNGSNNGANGGIGSGADTGDYSANALLIIVSILIPCALVMVLTAKRSNKNNKGGNE